MLRFVLAAIISAVTSTSRLAIAGVLICVLGGAAGAQSGDPIKAYEAKVSGLKGAVCAKSSQRTECELDLLEIEAELLSISMLVMDAKLDRELPGFDEKKFASKLDDAMGKFSAVQKSVEALLVRYAK